MECTPILGKSQVILSQIKQWAKTKNAHQRFIDIADLYYKYSQLIDIRLEFMYSQAAYESGFGWFTGKVTPDQNNWAGIKIKNPIYEERDDHETFATPDDGVRAHYNHIAAYVGLNPIGEPHDRFLVVSAKPWAGKIRYIEELSGKYSPLLNYHTTIIQFISEILKEGCGLQVRQKLVPESKWSIKCPYSMVPEFYVVHNTANDASAENEIAYMISNNNQTSFHYAIDDKEIVQGILENRNAWHASDGGDGAGNRKGIAIEICYSKSGGSKFIAAEKLAVKFIAEGLMKRGWGINKVKKHQDFARDNKYCPHRTLDMGWQRFLDMIMKEGDVDMEENGIVINSYADFTFVESLANKLNAGIFLRSIASKRQVARNIYVVGGGKEGIKGNSFVDLSGDNRFETAIKVYNFMGR